MKLKHLTIETIPSYEDNAGHYRAVIHYENERGEVSLILDPKISVALLEVCGPVIGEFSRKACEKLSDSITNSVAEVKQLPMHEVEV